MFLYQSYHIISSNIQFKFIHKINKKLLVRKKDKETIFILRIHTETVSAIALPILPRSSRTVIGRPSRIRNKAAGQSSYKKKSIQIIKNKSNFTLYL